MDIVERHPEVPEGDSGVQWQASVMEARRWQLDDCFGLLELV